MKKKTINTYRIEIYHMGTLMAEYEFTSFREAQQLYLKYNDLWNCWTKLYVNGQTGNKKWMDEQMSMAKRNFKVTLDKDVNV